MQIGSQVEEKADINAHHWYRSMIQEYESTGNTVSHIAPGTITHFEVWNISYPMLYAQPLLLTTLGTEDISISGHRAVSQLEK